MNFLKISSARITNKSADHPFAYIAMDDISSVCDHFDKTKIYMRNGDEIVISGSKAAEITKIITTSTGGRINTLEK